MKRIIFISFAVWLLASNCYASAGIKTDTGKVYLNFKNEVNGIPLKLNDTTVQYANANHDHFTVSTFKYYISNITLTTIEGKAVVIPNSYYLVNAADPSSLKQEMKGVPTGKYKAISFIIGVDSARNFGGAQSGSLDPANGMFWTWNSGYIFLMLEGNSPQSAAKFHKLTFHVGGIKRQNTLRTFARSFKKPMIITSNKPTSIEIKTDVAALFKGKNLINFSKLSYTMGGPNALLLADNYANTLFTIELIK